MKLQNLVLSAMALFTAVSCDLKSDLDANITPNSVDQASTSTIELSSNVVTLNSESPSQIITINNIGDNGTVSWSITQINADWLTVSTPCGDIAEGQCSTVIVSVDMEMVSQSTSTNVIVNADGESLPLMIKVEAVQNGSDDNIGTLVDPDQGVGQDDNNTSRLTMID